MGLTLGHSNGTDQHNPAGDSAGERDEVAVFGWISLRAKEESVWSVWGSAS